MSHQDKIELLENLGLTTLQAKVYLALINLEIGTASEAAKLSKIARPDAYRIIDQLSEWGLVSKILATPAKFQALPLKEATSILFERRTIRYYKLKIEMKKILEKDFTEKGKVKREEYAFQRLPENSPWFRNNALRFSRYKTFDLLTSARRLGSRIVFDEGPFRKGAKKGTKIRFLLDKPKPDSPLSHVLKNLNENKNLEVRFLKTESPVILIIMDKKQVALALRPSGRVGPPYLLSNHPSYLCMAQQYFEVQWEKASDS